MTDARDLHAATDEFPDDAAYAWWLDTHPDGFVLAVSAKDPPVLHRAAGCPACSGTGYRGRVGVHEVMAMTDEMEALVVTQATGSDMRELALAQGMTTLREDGWAKVLEGLTTIEEVLRVTV